MTRVSTVGNYTSVLANLMLSQQRQTEAGDRVGSQKNGQDLKDYARNAEMLTAMKTVATRVDGYIEQNKLVTERLTTQDFALSQFAASIDRSREAISEALALGRADNLMTELEANFRTGVESLNARYNGKYLFAGGQVNDPPVAAQGFADLAGPVSAIFKNDTYVASSRIDDATVVRTGFLAGDVGQDVMDDYKAIRDFDAVPGQAFSSPLTDAQKTFLEGLLKSFQTRYGEANQVVAKNGLAQARVEKVGEDLEARRTTLASMMGDITDADMAEAAVNLQQAQLSLQAAAQVFQTLKQSSLVNLLS